MRLSTILELLLIFLLIAFAAYGRVIDPEASSYGRRITEKNKSVASALKRVTSAKQAGTLPPKTTASALKQAAENVNKYCVCSENICNCCRDFHIPIVRLSGPGCASLQYLQEDKMAMQLSIGDNILSSSVVNGKNPKPVCVDLPGGFSKFCGKIYSIKREADKHFKACLGLELRSASELEASLRVSCFRFGPEGLKLRPAEPLPAVATEASTASEDDYDLFGLDDDDDDEEDEDDEDDEEKVPPANNNLSESEQEEEEEEEDDDSLLDIGSLFGDLFGEEEPPKKKPTTSSQSAISSAATLPPSFTIPILALTSTHLPPLANNAAPSAATAAVSKRPAGPAAASFGAGSTSLAPANPDKDMTSSSAMDEGERPEPEEPMGQVAGSEKHALSPADTTDYPQDAAAAATGSTEDVQQEESTDASEIDESTALPSSSGGGENATAAELEQQEAKPDTKLAPTAAPPAAMKKKPTTSSSSSPSLPPRKKLTDSAQSANAIKNEVKPQQQHIAEDDDDDDNDDEEEEEDDEDEDSEAEEDNEEAEDESEEEPTAAAAAVGVTLNGSKGDKKKVTEADKGDDNDDDDDDDDDEEEDESEEEEDAVLTALVGGEDEDVELQQKKTKKKASHKTSSNKTAAAAAAAQATQDDYSDELVELLARKQESRISEGPSVRRTRARQSKDMRF